MAAITGQFDDCDNTPREVDLLTEEHVEDLLDAVECLRGKVEQLQIQCEKLIYEKGKVEDELIQREKDFMERESNYNKETSSLRKLNLQLMAQVDSKQETINKNVPSWVKTSLDAEKALDEKYEAQEQVKSLQILIKEKDKQISNLEWQVMDAESTVTSIQAERDQLAVELDCMLAREEENLESLRDPVDEETFFSDDECNAAKLQHSRKKHARHLSDLTRREESHIEDLTDFVHKSRHASTLSSTDVPSATDAEFNGGLKRTSNFCNINNIDEFTDFHQDQTDGCDNSRSIDFAASYPLAKIKPLSSDWHSFGSESDSGISPLKNKQSTSWILSDMPSTEHINEGTHEEGCFDDASDWALDVEPAPLGSLVGGKNGSCRSSSSAYFSDNSSGQDPWTFTPDSIINVSTGEELKHTPSGSKTSLGSDSGVYNLTPEKANNKCHSQSDTSFQEMNKETNQQIKSTKDNPNNSAYEKQKLQNQEVLNEDANLQKQLDKHNSNNSKSQMKDKLILTKENEFSLNSKNGTSVLRNNLGPNNNCDLPSCDALERNASVRSDGAMSTPNKAVLHQRINSEPLPKSPSRRYSEDSEGVMKLEAYQKWRLNGKKGQPPAKLKISQC